MIDVIEDAWGMEGFYNLAITPWLQFSPSVEYIDCWQVDAAIVLLEGAGYSPVKIEIIAARGVRDALGIDDGDSLRLQIL